jgi:O-antigen/teichoic acid export membrane protein
LSTDKSLLKHGSFLFIVGLVSNLSNYFFHFYMTRKLSVPDYGTLYSLIALLNILGVGSGAIQLVTAQQIASALARGETGKAKSLFWYVFNWTLGAGVVLSLFYAISIPFLKGYLNLDSNQYLLLIIAPFLLSFIYPVLAGTLQGTQKFAGLGFNGLSVSLGRLLSGVFLVILGMGLNGALLSFPVSYLTGILLGFAMIDSSVWLTGGRSEERENLKLSEVFGHIGPTFLALGLYQIICQLDTIFVKHYFTPVEAGLYSSVSLVGKAFLYIPMAFTQVMVPKVSGEHAANRETRSLLNKTILYGFALCFAGIVVCVVFPTLILRLVSGNKYLSVAHLLQFFPIAITPLALSGIFLNYHLARLKTKFIISFIVITVLYVILLNLFHTTFYQVLWMVFICGSLLFGWNYYLIQTEK